MTQPVKRKLIVWEFVTMDGVMQAPGGSDEDAEDGFQHGGWQMPYMDEEFDKAVTVNILAADAMLLGRKTYDIFAGYWPKSKEKVSGPLNNMTKYVVSRTLKTVDWQNSVLIKGDVAPEVARLKQQPGKDILVFGSGDLLQTLLRHDLVDELKLAIHPLMLGSGKRVFRDGTPRKPFALFESRTTSKEILMLGYRPVRT